MKWFPWLGIFFWLGFIAFPLNAQAVTHDPLTTIELKGPVHFPATDGSDVEIQPGIYQVEGTGNEIRLTLKGHAAPILLSAQPTPFPEEVDAPIAMSISIENEGVYIAWLQPGGKGVETIGTSSPVQKRGFNLLNTPGKLTSQHIRQLQSFARQIANDPNSQTLKNDWPQVVKDITRQPSLRNTVNVQEMVMKVMREAIIDLNKDKQYWLKKLQKSNAMQKQLSQYIQDLNNKAKKLAGSEKAKLEEQIRSKQKELQTLGEDAQLANTDMQNALQRQQQMLQMMSNISKMLHDTAMAVIRKIG